MYHHNVPSSKVDFPSEGVLVQLLVCHAPIRLDIHQLQVSKLALRQSSFLLWDDILPTATSYILIKPVLFSSSPSGVLFVVCICFPWQYHLDLDPRVTRRLMD